MKLKDVKELTRAAIAGVTQGDWEKVVRHTVDVENKHWETEGLTDLVDPLVIHLDTDESDDDSDNEDDEDDMS